VLPPLLGDWSDRLGRLCSHSGRWRPGSGRPCTWSSAPSTPGPTLQLIVQPRSDSRLRRPCAPWAVSPPASTYVWDDADTTCPADSACSRSEPTAWPRRLHSTRPISLDSVYRRVSMRRAISTT